MVSGAVGCGRAGIRLSVERQMPFPGLYRVPIKRTICSIGHALRAVPALCNVLSARSSVERQMDLALRATWFQ